MRILNNVVESTYMLLYCKFIFLFMLILFYGQVFKTKNDACVVPHFLANYDTKSSATIKFGDEEYDISPWSISILPHCNAPTHLDLEILIIFD